MPVKPMEHSITAKDPNVTATNGTVAVMSDIYVYKVPRHTVILLRPEDVIAAYLKDAGAEAVVTDAFELVVRDPNKLSAEVICSGIYKEVQDFTDVNKTKKLGQSKLIKSDYQVTLRVSATTVLVVSTCYFKLSCLRYADVL